MQFTNKAYNRYDRLGPGWFAPGCPNAAEEPLDIGFVITDGKIIKNLAGMAS